MTRRLTKQDKEKKARWETFEKDHPGFDTGMARLERKLLKHSMIEKSRKAKRERKELRK